MNGHIDIGPIGDGWTKDPLGGEIANGKIYGRGTGDMKSGIAAMVCAAEAVVKSAIPRRGDLYLAFVADESSGGHLGSGYMVKHARIKADMGVICEPSGGHIGIAHRGVVWVRVTIHGKSGQAASPSSGINAISHTARVIAALEKNLPPVLGEKTHRLLPSPTFSLGTISGGVKTNVIAPSCTFTIDRRTIPGETAGEVTGQIKDICSKTLEGTGADISIEIDMIVEPSEILEDAVVVKECRNALRSIIDMEPILGGAGGFTDAHWFTNDLGIPTAIFGPWYLHFTGGSISDIPDECNFLDDIVKGTMIYARLIANVTS